MKPVLQEFIDSTEFKELLAGKAPAVEGVAPSSFPLITAALYQAGDVPLIAVLDSPARMNSFLTDLSCFLDESELAPIPPWDTLPYEFTAPPESVERQRITSIYRALRGHRALYVTAVEALLRNMPHRDFLLKRGMTLSVNEDYPFDDLIEMLVQYGYTRESRVESFGQFTVKGGIIDIFLPSLENPVRLDFFDTTLDSIRTFNINSQISEDELEEVILFPRRELILFEKESNELKAMLETARKEGKDIPDHIETHLEAGEGHIPGLEDLFPALIKPDTLLSLFEPSRKIVFIEKNELITRKNQISETFNELYERKQKRTLCVEPSRLLSDEAWHNASEEALTLQVFTATRDALLWDMKSLPSFFGRIPKVRDEIRQRITDGWKVTITTAFEGQARRLRDLLNEFNPPQEMEEMMAEASLQVLIEPFQQGLELPSLKRLIITDHEIFGKSYRRKKQFKKKGSRPIDSFLDLQENDHVVHINHGIGIFRKIERMSAGGVERDFILLEYADGDKLYVPLDQIHMVQKYIGSDGRQPRIDALGKKSAWNKIKKRVQENVEEIARQLIEIYSRRSAIKGFQYPPDTAWQEEFESLFEYEETPDQITAIEDVKDDMEKDKPMDRLVCGDVGFGKTEVAIRAAFKAVMAGRQVALLVPTTVLAMQHFNTFRSRFDSYPVQVEMLSRFRTAGQIRKIREELKEGRIDIIIGTHALLAKDMSIKNLGLLIIDEEQRFGVMHKEKLKSLKTQVDVLTLSATPIPRTLHMSLAGIRDLSIIETPPENRQSIDTFVMEENPDILRRAIMTELERDGQIFFVHNRVQTIDAMASMLQDLVPEASICVAHGQMGEHELEDIIIEFQRQKYDILVSTTIIESGIDMPRVNTIIINRADTFGLSQLHQLKGRVGRSNRKAYAYLFYPRHQSLTEEAQKRLQVIAEYSDLGSGFKIAMKDMEIRGAGNIVGKEQSGSIMEVGFELYTQMLQDAVARLKGEKPTTLFRTPVFFNTDVYIPESYMQDHRQKIEFYKRFESCETVQEVDELTREMIDRFGPHPEQVQTFIDLESLRAIASALVIEEIRENSRYIVIKITANSHIDRATLAESIASDDRVALDPHEPEILRFTPKSRESEKKLHELKKWLQGIS